MNCWIIHRCVVYSSFLLSAGQAAEEAATMGDAPLREAAVTMAGHEGAILSVRFNGSGDYCLSCGKDKTVRLWSPSKGLSIKVYPGHGYEVRDVAPSSDNSKFCSVGGDRSIPLWDVGTGRVIRRFRGHDSTVNTVKFNRDNTIVVTGGYDKCVKVWDCRSQAMDAIQILKDFRDSVTSVVVTDFEIIASSVDGTVRSYDLRAGRLVSDHVGHPVTCISLSNDSNCLLASCMDSMVRLIDRTNGELLCAYRGHKNSDFRVESCFSSTDELVISGSEDGRIFVWKLLSNTVNSEEQASWKAHESVVTALARHPREEMLLSCSIDGLIKVWT